ncbi:QRFP-like peptide receptor isoform X2 [Aethina tumida]|nr:QRFP-like peptide receptor isoform X2 [Aethina tumida]
MADSNDYDGYYNNKEESYRVFFWNELIPPLVVYAVTFVLGLTGNCLMIVTTFRYRRMHSVTNVFLCSLASSDLLLIIICIPVKIAKLFSYTWDMGYVLCKTVHYMQNVSAICSVLTLTAISIERYYAIVHPMRAKYICTISQAKKIILVIWIVSFVLGEPTLHAQILYPVGINKTFFWCVRDWDHLAVWKFHEVYMLIIILIIPFCIMTLSYSLICWEVWQLMERRFVMTSEQALTRNHTVHGNSREDSELGNLKRSSKLKHTRDDTQMVKQVICMLIAVVVVFAICWTPLLVDNVLMAFDILPALRGGSLKQMNTAFHLMAYCNSSLNPIIYGFMSRSFRKGFLRTLCCSKDNRSKTNSVTLRQNSRNGSQTRSTLIR